MIDEPMTMLTDYVLAAVTAWLGWLLFRAREGEAGAFRRAAPRKATSLSEGPRAAGGSTSRTFWALAFAALALGSALGGTYHGFASKLGDSTHHLLWKATVLTIGVASFGMTVGSAVAVTADFPRKLLVAFAAVKLALYSGWMLTHDAFIYVIADTGIAMAVVAALHAWSAMRNRDRASLWILGAVGISLVAAGVQASRLTLHPGFNHNDLYHVIQIAAMALFYTGARRLRDRHQRNETE